VRYPLFILGALAGAASEYPSPLVREEQTVTIDRRQEVWRLVWATAPGPYCEAGGEDWYTCPCYGFAVGEIGDLYLTRPAGGVEVDRLRATPLYSTSDPDVRAVQRWQPASDDLKGHWWDELRQASGPVETIVWRCGGHGAESEIALFLHWRGKGIDGTRRVCSCSDAPGGRRLINETPLGERPQKKRR
jgi:hypothetical protein